MVRLSVATLSLAALAGVAIVNAQPIDFESGSSQLASRAEVSDLAERGAFGRLGRIFRPFFSSGIAQAGKTAIQGHAKANKVVRRDFDEDLLERDFSDEELQELVERGAFGRLGRIFRPFFSSGIAQAGKTAIQGHAKANKVVRRDFDEDLLERDFSDEELQELVERGAFGRLGRIFRPFFSSGIAQAGKTAIQGHAKANKVARRDLDLELDELVERYFGDDEEWLERSYGEDSFEDLD